MLKCLDLFSGIGGFAIAAHTVGRIETTQFVEWNQFCTKVLQKNFPDVPVHSDIRDYYPKEGEFDLICGGSPCQDLSIAGKQKGIIEGDRSSLWFEMLRIIKEVKPKFVVWENVHGAIRNGGVAEVLRGLYRANYRFDAQIISAKEVGAPHLRERVFVVAYRESSANLIADSNRLVQADRSNLLIPWAEQIGGGIAIAANSNSNRLERANWQELQRSQSHGEGSRLDRAIQGTGIIPDVCRVDDEFSDWVDWYSRLIPACGVPRKFPDRNARLSALGNSIVPACAAIALKRVLYLQEFLYGES
jgi:DNA (cytosine-5)-methyltransferase 1